MFLIMHQGSYLSIYFKVISSSFLIKCLFTSFALTFVIKNHTKKIDINTQINKRVRVVLLGLHKLQNVKAKQIQCKSNKQTNKTTKL